MHDSNKLWVMIAVFLVIMGLLVGMYLTASPDKLLKKPVNNKPAVTAQQEQTAVDQNAVSDGQKSIEAGINDPEKPEAEEVLETQA
ncbi:MAG: hypothetical protein LBR69_02500 [Endomicrobium sp.]|jgi:uncharacterized protein YneF (UPF0154 family)|nr:hypothetical protein [Endomicrobium sp.]